MEQPYSRVVFVWSSVVMMIMALSGQAFAQSEAENAKKVQEDLERALGTYLMKPSMRDAMEGVVVTPGRAEVWFQRSLDRLPEKSKCEAYRWLFLGRLNASSGVLPFFKAHPEINQVTLVFYKVTSEVKADGRQGYIQNRSALRQLEITVSRDRALALSPQALEKTLLGDRSVCIDKGQKLVNQHWYIK